MEDAATGSRCPKLGRVLLIDQCLRAASLQSDEGRCKGAAVAERAGRCGGITVPRFHQILDDESAPAETTNQFLPAVKEFHRAGFAVVPSVASRWERAGAIVGLGEQQTFGAGNGLGLQGGGLFVLADVESAGGGYARDFAINGGDVGHIAGAHGLDDEIKRGVAKSGKVVHRRFDDTDGQATFSGELAVEIEHARAEIDDGDNGSSGSEKDAVFSSARGEAEDPLSTDVALEPAAVVDDGEGIAQVGVAGSLGVRLSLTDAFIPSATILFKERR
jgi:hypothetical protein